MLIPRARLVIPPLIPIALLGISFAADRMGHQWNIHGDAVAMMFFFLASCLVALVIEIVTLFKVVPILRRSAESRSAINLLCTGFAVLSVVGAIGLALYVAGKLSHQ